MISEIMDQIEESVKEYFISYNDKSKGSKQVPTIDEIEDMVSELKYKTRDIYLKMLGESLNNTDESELISSKKENT
jgi:hypothetical protein